MSQSVVYADLKFATAPPVTIPTAPDEDDSPYENLPLGPMPTVPSPGHWPHRWRFPMRLRAASLLLLLLLVVLLAVATVSLGACYWQVTRSLHDASREHVAEQAHLSQEVSAREQSLEQTRQELVWARAELQQAWQEGNSSQRELGSLNTELGRVMKVLGKTEEEMQEVQWKLNNSESTVNSLRACVNTDCCPTGWVLYRSKCLFISVEKKTWFQSSEDCRKKSARLLVQGSWTSWTMPDFMQEYWIGAVFPFGTKRTIVWQDSKYFNLYSHPTNCGLSANKNIESSKCIRKYQWICEQPPNLSI